MKLLSLFAVLILMLAAAPPARADWYLGNLHCHSARSNDTNGALARTPAQVAQFYFDGGFDFLCISDHDSGTGNAAETITDTSALSHIAMNAYVFLGITGSEVSRHRPHIGAPGMRDLIPPSVADTMGRMQAIYNLGGVPILNHPRWSNNMGNTNEETADAIYLLGNFRLMEIWNTNTIDRTQDPLVGHLDLDTWDLVLNKDMYVIGIGTDDAHFNSDTLDAIPKALTGAVMVRAATLSWENVRDGMLAGDCYAVVRPDHNALWCTLDDQVVSPTGLYVDSPNAVSINFVVYDMAGAKLPVAEVVDGASGDLRPGPGIAASYAFTGNERFVRAVASNAGGANAMSEPSFRLSVPARMLQSAAGALAFDTIPDVESGLTWYRCEDPVAARQRVDRGDEPPYTDFAPIATLPMSATRFADAEVVDGSTRAYRIATELSDNRDDTYSEPLLVGTAQVINSNQFMLDFAATNQLGLFTIHDDVGALASAPSSWSISGGVLHQDSNIFTDPSAGGNYLATYAVLNLPDKRDYVFEFDLNSGDNDTIGCVWRWQGPRQFYQFQWDAQRGLLRVLNYTGEPTPQVVADKSSSGPGYAMATTYRVRVTAIGSQHTLTISGGDLAAPIVLEFTDASHDVGGPGFYTWGNTPSMFDNVAFHVVGDPPTPTPTATPSHTPTPTPTLSPTWTPTLPPTPTPTPAGPADLWRDGREDALDVLFFSVLWKQEVEGWMMLPEEYGSDGLIDENDLVFLLERLLLR